MSRHRPLLGEAVAAHLQAGGFPVLRHRTAGEKDRFARAVTAALGLGLAASAILQADAERRAPARPDARLGAGREDSQADLRRQSGGRIRLPAGMSSPMLTRGLLLSIGLLLLLAHAGPASAADLPVEP